MLLAEAIDLSKFIAARYAADEEGPERVPGLADADLPPTIGAEIDGLIEEGERVAFALTAPTAGFPLERVQHIVDETAAALTWLGSDDGALAERLRQVDAQHRSEARRRSESEWVLLLCAYLTLADDVAGRLARLRAFDARLLVEGRALADAHRKAGVTPERRALLRRAAAIAESLRVRMRRVTAAASYVFRLHPDIALEARSETVRRRAESVVRTARAKRTAAKLPAVTPPVATPLATPAVTPPATPAETPPPT